MLGFLKSEQYWYWAAYGKHPVSKDFFRLGRDFPLMKNFSDWVEKGYGMLTSKNKTTHKTCSWRFWAKGTRKEALICGLVRDSSDRLGRPYPLLIMGTGNLNDCEEQWELLPFACEKTWNHIEYLSAQLYNDLKKLEVEILNIRPPYSAWLEFKTKTENNVDFHKTPDNTASQCLKDFKAMASGLSKKTECMISLDDKLFHNQTELIYHWHLLFKTHQSSIPNAIFMGGTMENTYLVFFRRPLTPSDFAMLWSANFPDTMVGESLINS